MYLTLVISVFALIVLTTFALHKLLMDSRINYLEDKLEDLRKEKFSLELEVKYIQNEYFDLLDNLSLNSSNEGLNSSYSYKQKRKGNV